MEQRTKVCWNLVHRTVSGAPAEAASKPATLGFLPGVLHYNSPDCPVCHRTVRWASGATSPYAPTVDCAELQWWTVSRQKSKGTGLSGVALDCPVQVEDKCLQRSIAPNPNGCTDMARTGQCTVVVRWRTGLSGAPITSSLCQWLESGWGL
jgi:hypothetical protein